MFTNLQNCYSAIFTLCNIITVKHLLLLIQHRYQNETLTNIATLSQ